MKPRATPAKQPSIGTGKEAKSAGPVVPNRRKRMVQVVAILVLLVAGAGVTRWWFRPPPVRPPALPEVPDAQVRDLLAKARKEVVAKPTAANWGRLGLMFLALTLGQEARACFAEAARLDPADARWPYGLGLVAIRHEPDKALTYLRQAAASESRPEYRTAFRYQLALTLLERKELDESEKLFHEEWQRQPGTARAALGLGLVALERGDSKRAAELLYLARGSELTRNAATAQLALLARTRGDLDSAEKYEKEALALPPDQPWPDPFLQEMNRFRVDNDSQLHRMVHELESQRRWAEAAELYKKHIKENPTAGWAYVAAGIELARLGDYNSAVNYFREGVRLDPESVKAHLNLAVALLRQGVNAGQQSAVSSDAKKWLTEAVQHARFAAEREPGNASAYLYWGLALKNLGDSAAAVAPLRKGVACQPEMFELLLALGEVLLETGSRQEAETHLESARRIDPKDPRPARALERLRKK